jgi:hypothetical protein
MAIVLACVSLFAIRAEASPVVVSFSDMLGPGQGPLDGLALTGSFSYDDPYGIAGCATCTFDPLITFPMLSLSLSIGSHRFNLSDMMPGAHVQGPLGHFVWGPNAQFASRSLPLGLSSMSFLANATVYLMFTTLDGGAYLYEPSSLSLSAATRRSVPEPGSLAIVGGALMALAFRRRLRRMQA